jgi:hypothetical protein
MHVQADLMAYVLRKSHGIWNGNPCSKTLNLLSSALNIRSFHLELSPKTWVSSQILLQAIAKTLPFPIQTGSNKLQQPQLSTILVFLQDASKNTALQF